jgi:hypothetical protein
VVAPNFEHVKYTAQWAAAFPNANVYGAQALHLPPARGSGPSFLRCLVRSLRLVASTGCALRVCERSCAQAVCCGVPSRQPLVRPRALKVQVVGGCWPFAGCPGLKRKMPQLPLTASVGDPQAAAASWPQEIEYRWLDCTSPPAPSICSSPHGTPLPPHSPWGL